MNKKALLSIAVQCVVIFGVTAFLLVAAEFSLRLFFTAGSERWYTNYHPRYLFYPNTNLSHTFKRSEANGGEFIVSRINAWGFRGDDFDRETQEIRVMVYGDSNIAALFSEYEHTFVARLESELEARSGLDLRVINAGVRGYGPDQVLLRMKDELPLWKPDLVIVHVFADNDFGDLVRNRLFHVDRDTGELVHRGVPRIDRLIAYAQQDLYLMKAARRVSLMVAQLGSGAADDSLPAVAPGESELDRYKRLIEAEMEAYSDLSLPRQRDDHYDLDIALDSDRESSRLKLLLMERILREIFLESSAPHGAPVVFLIQPSVKDISTNAELNFQQLRSLSDTYDRRNLTGSLEAFLKELDASYLNLFDAFVTDGPTPYYFVLDDNHWNDSGQALAAKLMADHIDTHHQDVLRP